MKYIFCILTLCLGWHTAIAQRSNQVKNHTISSKFLKEKRLVRVSTPVGYTASAKAYPVLYVLDGEWVFNFATGFTRFMSNDFGSFPKTIVVGISNTDRDRDLSATLKPNAGYHRFLDFIEKEVYPLINKQYRTNGFNIFYGWSSGSGISKQMMLTRAHLFDAFIEAGSGIGTKTATFLVQNIGKQNYQNKYLYVNTEGNSHRGEGFKKYQALIEKQQPKGLKYKFELLSQLNHTEVVSQGLSNGLRFVFAAFKLPSSVISQGAEAIIGYYQSIDQQYNFKVEIPEGMINEATLMLLYGVNKPKEALKIAQHGLTLHPTSVTLAANLASLYAEQKKNKQAAQYYKLAYTQAARQGLPAFEMKYKMLYQKVKNLPEGE